MTGGAPPLAFCAVALALIDIEAHGSLYTTRLATLFCIYGALALSLSLAVRFVGQYSLAHSGLFAIGAYACAIPTNHWTNLSPFVTLPIAVAIASVAGLLLGAVSLRLGGLYFAIFTLMFAIALSFAISNWDSFTKGDAGILGPIFPGLPSALSWLGDPLTWASAVLALLAVFISWNLRRSPAFPMLTAVRESERLAKAFAVPTTRVKLGLFTLSAAIAGAAGWLFAFLGVVSPPSFTYVFSVTILVMVLLGGLHWTVGPLIGAAFVVYFPEKVTITGDSRQLLYGGLLIFVMLVVPTGVMGVAGTTIGTVGERLRRRKPIEAPSGAATLAPAVDPAIDRDPSPLPQAAAGIPAILCEQVSFGYVSGSLALHSVGLEVEQGTIHGLIGANGSGKSTLLNVISGFLEPSGGRVAVLGSDVHDLGVEERARLGVRRTFQTAEILADLTCLQNCMVALHGDIRWLPVRAPVWSMDPRAGRLHRQLEEKCMDALRWAGIEEWAGRPAGSVPHAVQQMLQVARAYVSRPRIVLLDEPAAGLTPGEVHALAERLRSLRAAGITLLIVEHLVQFIFSLCDQVTVLDAGEIVESGPPAAIRQSEDVRRVYLGAHVNG